MGLLKTAAFSTLLKRKYFSYQIVFPKFLAFSDHFWPFSIIFRIYQNTKLFDVRGLQFKNGHDSQLWAIYCKAYLLLESLVFQF